MRIAFVAHHGSLHTQRWAAFFADRGHEVDVVTCGDGEGPIADYGIHDLGTPPFGKGGYLLRIRGARRVVRRLRPDVVHAHYATSYGLLGLATGVRPLVVTAHGSDLLIAARNPVFRFVIRRVLRRAALVTVPSPAMRDVVRDLVGPDLEVSIFQYGVESERLELIASDERSKLEPGRAVRIVSARPLERVYRTDALLDGLAVLAERREDWDCVLFGDGPERVGLERQVERLGLADRVSFRGDRPAAEVERGLAQADLYASFSESDGASIALLEAMALGALPVVSDIPAGRAWIRDGENGILAAIDAHEVADGLERAMAMNRARVAEANREIVRERADRERNLSRFEERLESLVTSVQDAPSAG